jgi:hypothetical protein
MNTHSSPLWVENILETIITLELLNAVLNLADPAHDVEWGGITGRQRELPEGDCRLSKRGGSRRQRRKSVHPMDNAYP